MSNFLLITAIVGLLFMQWRLMLFGRVCKGLAENQVDLAGVVIRILRETDLGDEHVEQLDEIDKVIRDHKRKTRPGDKRK